MREFSACQHTSFDRLHVDIASRLDARVAQSPLRVLERPVMLQMRTQRSPHHLKRNEPVRDTKLPGNRPDPPVRKFLPQRGTACPLRLPRPKVGNIRASGDGSGHTCCHA